MSSVSDSPGPTPGTIHPALARALTARGYDTLTPVQLAILTPQTDGRDLLVSAQTGSGKTVAFGMALAPTLLAAEERFGPAGQPLALLVAPTRELALQVQRELDWLYAEAGVVTASCVGGMDSRTERRALQRGAHIVIGTPGRLRDHIERNALDLGGIRAVVLDEADEMLDLGFREDLEFILGSAPEERRTLMFSATVPRTIADLARTYQRDALRVQATAARERHADIAYELMLVQGDDRESAIINTLLFHDQSNALVFCHTREAVKGLAARLNERGFAAVVLSGELTQAERTSALQAMRDGRARICVATDVAARGIDLPNLDLVIHGEVPSNPDTLLHRSGRTGRAGRKGLCVLVVPMHRRAAALRVLKLANIDAATRRPPSASDIEANHTRRMLEDAAAQPQPTEEEAPLVAELLARTSPEQLAAAYLRQRLADRPQAAVIAAQPAIDTSRPERRNRHEDRASRPTGDEAGAPSRRADMQGGVWFTLSLGRKHRADPKWLLPMICKAGEVTKQEVGSIKIEETETRFEIAADAAMAFAERIARNGSGEKGVTIALATGRPPIPDRAPPQKKPRWVPSSDDTRPPRRSEAPADAPRGTAKYAKRKPDSSSASDRPAWAGAKAPKSGKAGPGKSASGKPARAAFNPADNSASKPAADAARPPKPGKKARAGDAPRRRPEA